MLLSKQQLMIHHTASKDGSRPILNQIYAYKEKDQVVAVSTDGYVLTEVREATPALENYPEVNPDVPNKEIESCFIQASVAKKMIANLPKNPVLPILGYALVQKNELITTDLERTVKYLTHEQEGKYPEYQKMVPEPAAFCVNINPDKLRQALEVFRGETMTVSIEFGEKPLDPVVLRGKRNGATITSIVMPLRA